VKQLQGSGVLFAGVAVVMMAAQPVWAEAAKVTAVGLNPTNSGFNVVLETTTGTVRPQVFTSKRGNTLIADIINAQLRLPQGNNFRQDKPAPGINSVVITQLDPNSIRLVVTGITSAPSGQVVQRNPKGITLSISPTAGTSSAAAAPANNPAANTTPLKPGQTLTVEKPNVLVPNPEVKIGGAQSTQSAPPTLPRAIAPPVGDIAVSNNDSSPAIIDLETNERVPRLVLRDAPVREVLSLLARAAGLNLAFTTATPPGGQQQQQPQQSTPGAADEGPKISLDIQDESVQDVFNYVLRISGLQANKQGRTIFVGTRLPNEARNLSVRSMRLNQVNVGVALNFLVAMGAESAVSRERTVTSVQAVPVGGAAAPATQTQSSTETVVETRRIDLQDSIPLLRGLQVVGDERTNSVTLIGSPKQIDIATAQLVQLDSRRRQVAVNVKIVDVNLLATEDLNTSFSFGIGDTFVQNDRGSAILNFGTTNPQPERNRQAPNPPGFARRFLSRLQAQVQSGNAKILTDPTLTVQEGQTAQVNLTQEVPAGTEIQYVTANQGGNAIPVQRVVVKDAGLTVVLRIERIDDNGFVTLSVAPTVSAPTQTIDTGLGDVTLLNERSLTSGQIRLRDGQTLILSGIIQDSDRTAVSKIPILGDIPILGALFRSTTRNNQRQEVLVLLTPQIIDDSERSSSMGYNYTPSPDVRQMLERNRGLKTPSNNR
jgi:type IV pilus assembly protein PilQ